MTLVDAKSRLLQVAEPGADLQLGRQAVEHPRVSQAQAAGGAEENISIRSNLLKLQVLLSIGNNLGMGGFNTFLFFKLFFSFIINKNRNLTRESILKSA